jgi:hypothetical protein
LADAFDLRQPGAFRSGAQRPGLLLAGIGLQGLTEQVRLSQHALALLAVGLLVVLVPGAQLAGGQGLALQGGEQSLRLFGVGARQRGQNSDRGPGGELTGAHGDEHRLGQVLEQRQAPADPARIPARLPRHLALGKATLPDQLADDGAFLDRLPSAPLNPYQDQQQGLRQRALPQLHPGGIARQAAQGLDAQVTVDQHPWRLLVLVHHHHRHQLTALRDRADQAFDRPGLSHAQGGKTQIQPVQIRFQGLDAKGAHEDKATRLRRPKR